MFAITVAAPEDNASERFPNRLRKRTDALLYITPYVIQIPIREALFANPQY
jgi:hypothetical protein